MNTQAPITADTTNPRLFTATMTQETPDREGDVVLMDGIDFTNFIANPVLMYEHGKDGKTGKIPVGKVNSAQRVGNSFEVKPEFATRPENHPAGVEWIPDTLCSLMGQKCLNAVSIGFIEKESRKATAADKQKYGKNAKKIITKSELIELSVTGTPVHQSALVKTVGKSMKEKTVVKVEIKTICKVEIDPTDKIEKIVMARVKGNLYA